MANAKARFFWDNWADEAVLACSSYAAGFPPVMLQDLDPSKLCKSATPDILTVTGSWGSTYFCNCLVVHNHNLSVWGKIKLTTDQGHSWEWDAWEPIYPFGYGYLGMGPVGGYPSARDMQSIGARPSRFCYFEPAGFKSFTLELSEPNQPGTYPGFGRMFLGPAFETSRNFNRNHGLGAGDPSEDEKLPNGGRRHRVHPALWRASIEIAQIPKDEAFSVHLPAQWRHGSHLPFFVDLFPDGSGMERLQGQRYAVNLSKGITGFQALQSGWVAMDLEEYR
jgi:hypothetical protein